MSGSVIPIASSGRQVFYDPDGKKWWIVKADGSLAPYRESGRQIDPSKFSTVGTSRPPPQTELDLKIARLLRRAAIQPSLPFTIEQREAEALCDQFGLRPYQREAIYSAIDALIEPGCPAVLQLPTGAGKTLVAVVLSKIVGHRVLFVIPRLALIDQTIRAFEKAGLKHIGVIQRTHARTDPAAPLQIASADTLTRRDFQDFDLVVIDECHIAREKLYGFMKDWPRVIGLSATPWTRGMGKHWKRLIIPTSIKELIATGYLCDFSALCPAIDLGKVRIIAGEFHEGDLSKACDTFELCANIVETWQREGQDRPTLLYAIDRNHARHLQERFKEARVACGYVDMYTKSEERDALFEQLRCGELKFICSVATLEVGVDLPLVSCIIDARPTKSLMRWVQTLGRGLRQSPETGKRDLLILDHAGNHNRFGCTIADLETPSELHGGSKKRSFDKSTPYQHKPLKTCDICGFMVKRGAAHCPKGHPVVTASEHIESDGILVPFGTRLDELDYPPEPTRTDKQAFYSGLRWIAIDKGYSPVWARLRFKERFGYWPNGPGTRLNLKESEAPPSIEVRNFVRAQQRQYCRGAKCRAGGFR